MSGKSASIDRLSELAQQWFLSEPLLFSVWTTHKIVPHSRIATIRVGRGLIEVNPEFVDSLAAQTLREVMKFEAVRIVLKHPYERRKTNTELSYEASNLAIQECMRMALPLPSAEERFGSDEHDRKYFEYYYQLLNSQQTLSPFMDPESDEGYENNEDHGDAGTDEADCDSASDEENCKRAEHGDGKCEGSDSSGDELGRSGSGQPSPFLDGPVAAEAKSEIGCYCDQELVAIENASHWDDNIFFCERINEVITEIEASQSWGTVPGTAREAILATLIPKLDYRRVLRAFRANILSSQRRLTRMKPSRRYGFAYMGSRRDYCTKLLFAVDVSGSVGSADVQAAFSIVNRLFKYGIESIDVIWFDTQIRNEEPIELKRALRQFEVNGRGGTAFQPLMDYLDDHRQYDGLIVFTDGIAPVPTPPQRNGRTRVVWLFNHEENWKLHHAGLEESKMLTAFVLAD